MPRKSKRDQEIEELKKQLQQQQESLQQQQEALTTALTAALSGQRTSIVSKPVVGIRNVSSITIGLVGPTKDDGEISLFGVPMGSRPHPGSTAIISEAFWRQIRGGPLVAQGMIVRDDSLLGENHTPVAPDGPNDLAVGHEVNTIEDPFEWIESRTEAQMRDDLFKITSEPTLRRLQAAVSYKIWSIGEEKYKDHPERGKLALNDLPGVYEKLDRLVMQRIDEFMPQHKTRHLETHTTARFEGII